jgi:hypothetical protein
MSKPNKMINDPYAVEIQIQQLMNDRKLWLTGQKYKSLNLEQFNKKMEEEYGYLKTASNVLFSKVLSGFMDKQENMHMLMMMLNLSKDVYDGKRKQDEVDKGLGALLAQKYVNPVVDKLNKDETTSN